LVAARYKGYFYTNKTCDFINIDHIVSLKDAYGSGAASWSADKKQAFANDMSNHVPSCERVNSSKGSEGPKDFLRRSNDGKGLGYELSFEANHKATFLSCGVTF
jgi:5-methylcytosine-specific restriction endonuclease McrA